jgi:hypothetical protein
MSYYCKPSNITITSSEHFEDPPEPIPDLVTSASLPIAVMETEEPAKNVYRGFHLGNGFVKIKQEFPQYPNYSSVDELGGLDVYQSTDNDSMASVSIKHSHQPVHYSI